MMLTERGILRIGITGGIGSGKSYVCQLMQRHLSIPIYNCDERAKQLIASDQGIHSSLVSLIGKEVYNNAGELNRQVLAEYLFASAEHAIQVNAIVHPVVRRDFRNWVKGQNAQVVGMESAILYESGFDSEVDAVMMVDAPMETRIQRAMLRDAATQEQIERRIKQQNTNIARTKSDLIIINDGMTSDEEIIKQIKTKILC